MNQSTNPGLMRVPAISLAPEHGVTTSSDKLLVRVPELQVLINLSYFSFSLRTRIHTFCCKIHISPLTFINFFLYFSKSFIQCLLVASKDPCKRTQQVTTMLGPTSRELLGVVGACFVVHANERNSLQTLLA